MTKLFSKCLVAMCLLSTPLAAQEAVAFNGYSVTIEGRPDSSSAGLPIASDAMTDEAERICAAVGKTAEFASAKMVSSSYAEAFFLCL